MQVNKWSGQLKTPLLPFYNQCQKLHFLKCKRINRLELQLIRTDWGILAKTGDVEETVEDFHGRHKTMTEWKYCRFIMVIGSLTVLFLVGRVLELPLKKTIIGPFVIHPGGTTKNKTVRVEF